MGANNKPVLVVTLPQGLLPHGVDQLEEMRDYVIDSIRKSVLVLGIGTELEMKPLPELSGVLVQDADGRLVAAAPVVPESDTDAAAEAEDMPPSNEQEPPTLEPPRVLREHDLDRATAVSTKRGGWELPMTPGEIVTSYRQAANPVAQLRVLADLNVCSKDDIIEVLTAQGVEVKKKSGTSPEEGTGWNVDDSSNGSWGWGCHGMMPDAWRTPAMAICRTATCSLSSSPHGLTRSAASGRELSCPARLMRCSDLPSRPRQLTPPLGA